MPPKSKAAAIPTIDELHEANEKIDTAENPAEADYAKILAAAKGDTQLKSLAARLIPRYIEKFPKFNKEALNAQIGLVKDEDSTVRIQAVQGLKEFLNIDKDAANVAILNALGDEETNKTASQYVKTQFEAPESEEYKKLFFNSINKVDAASQAKMIEYIVENYKFNEENVDSLIEVLTSALNVDVLSGLRIMSRKEHRAILPEAKKIELEAQLINNLEASIETQFEEVCEQLLTTILKFTRYLSDETNKRVYTIVATKVLPRIDTLSNQTKIKIIQEIAEHSMEIAVPEVLSALYEHVFMQFPTASDVKFNFSLIEATLFAVFRLARKFTSVASAAIGVLLVRTGQPGENEGVSEDAKKKAAFDARLKAIDEVAGKFVDSMSGRIEAMKKETVGDKTALTEAKIAARCGRNCARFCKVLQGPNFVSQTRVPDQVSWRRPDMKKQKQKPQRPTGKRGGPNQNRRPQPNQRQQSNQRQRGGDRRGYERRERR